MQSSLLAATLALALLVSAAPAQAACDIRSCDTELSLAGTKVCVHRSGQVSVGESCGGNVLRTVEEAVEETSCWLGLPSCYSDPPSGTPDVGSYPILP